MRSAGVATRKRIATRPGTAGHWINDTCIRVARSRKDVPVRDTRAVQVRNETAAGRFAADLKGTWIDRYDAFDLPGQAPTDRINVANSFGTIAQWRAIASLDWQRGALGATTYVRYIPSYDDTREGVRNGRTIRSQTFLDLQFSLDLAANYVRIVTNHELELTVRQRCSLGIGARHYSPS